MEAECAGRLSLPPGLPSPAVVLEQGCHCEPRLDPGAGSRGIALVQSLWFRQASPDFSPDLGCYLGGVTVISLTLTFLPDKVPALRELVVFTSSALPCLRARAGP